MCKCKRKATIKTTGSSQIQRKTKVKTREQLIAEIKANMKRRRNLKN